MRPLHRTDCLVAILGICLHGAALAAPPVWPMFGHDAAHSGRSKVTGSQEARLNWASETRTFSGLDFVPDLDEFSPVVAADGTVYYADGEGVVALGEDGAVRWVHPLAEASASVALGRDGTVYVAHAHGLAALDAEEGNARWNYASSVPLHWPVVLPDGHIVAGSLPVQQGKSLGTGALVEIDASGSRVRRVTVPGGPTATPAAGADSTLLVPARECTKWRWFDQAATCMTYRAQLMAAASGDHAAHAIFHSPKGDLSQFHSPAIASDGSIYVTGIVGSQVSLYGLDGVGRARWNVDLDCCDASAPSIAPGGVVVVETAGGSTSKVVHAVASDGTLRWRTALPRGLGGLRRPAIDAHGTIYGSEVKGTVHALTSTGDVLWSMALDAKSAYCAPAIGADGSVVLVGSRFDAKSFTYAWTVSAIGPGPGHDANR